MFHSERNYPILLWIAAFVFCVVFWVYFGPVWGGDTASYLGIAYHFIDGEFYQLVSDAFRPPGYPGFLYLIFKISENRMNVVVLIQAILSAFTATIIYSTASEIFDKKTGRVSGWLVAFNPALAFFSVNILSETLAIFLVTLAVYLIHKGIDKDEIKYFLISGLVFALLLLTKPIGLFIGIFSLLAFILIPSINRKIIKSVLIVLPMVLTYFVWNTHNYFKFGYFIYSPLTGFNLIERTIYLESPRVNSEIIKDVYDYYYQIKAEDRLQPQTEDFYFWKAVIQTSKSYLQTSNVFEVNKKYSELAKTLILENPLGYLKATVGELAYIWAGYLPTTGKLRPVMVENSPKDWTFLFFGWILGFVMVALVLLSTIMNLVQRRWRSLLLIFPAILVPLIYALISFTGYRYRLVVEPLIIALISFMIVNFKSGMELKK